VIARIRNLAVGIAKAWIEQQSAAELKTVSKPAEKAREQVTT